MFSKIMYVTVFVSDQDKALDFYTNSFGFQKHADYKGPEGRFLTIALKDQGFEVLLWLGSAGVANAKGGVGTLFIESDDLWKDFADLMIKSGVYPAKLDVSKAYTLQFVNKRVGLAQQ